MRIGFYITPFSIEEGKDRQDAKKIKLHAAYNENILGDNNPDNITNIITDIIVNSLEKPYLAISDDVWQALEKIVKENNDQIYQRAEVTEKYYSTIRPMMKALYIRFLHDFENSKYSSPIFKHYLNGKVNYPRHKEMRYILKDKIKPHDVVTDFIASMTDDYFVSVFSYLFPNHELSSQIEYIDYFDERYLT